MELRLDSASDQAILTALRSRRWKNAADLIVQSYSPIVFSACRCAIASSDAAEELTYESFSRAFGTLSDFRAEGSPGRWLLEIAFDRCDERRLDCDDEVEEAASEQRTQSANLGALAKMSPAERFAVAMTFRFGAARAVVEERIGAEQLESALARACSLLEVADREALGEAIRALEWRVGESLRRRLDALCAAL